MNIAGAASRRVSGLVGGKDRHDCASGAAQVDRSCAHLAASFQFQVRDSFQLLEINYNNSTSQFSQMFHKHTNKKCVFRAIREYIERLLNGNARCAQGGEWRDI